MSWEENLAKIQETLRTEVQKRWGRIGKIEHEIAMWDGALSDVYAGRVPLRFDYLLRILDGLDLDPATFFRQALGSPPLADDLLAGLEVEDDEDRGLERITGAARKLASAEPPLADSLAETGAEGVAELTGLGTREHLRRLRSTRRFRTHAFARAYLEYLDRLRYDEAPRAAKRAEVVATVVLPALPGPQEERISLQCLALGVFGSSRRVKGRFTAAARAFRLGLELARQKGLREETAQLLQRASYLQRDFGQYRNGLCLLREALEIYFDISSRSGLGKTLVDRGMMLCYLGEYENAVVVLDRALSYLDVGDKGLLRNHLSAYQFLAYAHEHLGDLETAERCLGQGAREFSSEHEVDGAKLRWLQGTLAFKRGEFQRSEALLRSARKVLAENENAIQEAVITVDLVEALIAQGALVEACSIARNMARLLNRFRRNQLAEMATVQLVRSGIEGSLTQKSIEQAREAFKRVRNPNSAAQPTPSRSGQ